MGGLGVPHPGAHWPPCFHFRLEPLQGRDLHHAPGCWDPGGGRLGGSYPTVGGHMPGRSPAGSTSGWVDNPCPAGTVGGTRLLGHHQSWGDRAQDALEHARRGRSEGPIPAGKLSLQGEGLSLGQSRDGTWGGLGPTGGFTLSGWFADVAAAGGAALGRPGAAAVSVTQLQAGSQGAPQHHRAHTGLCCSIVSPW